jgi:uncharacterized protein (TIGR03000 family)
MCRRWFPVGAVVAAALLLAPAPARAQFRGGFRGRFRPVPVIVVPPIGLPFTFPAFYPPGLWPYAPDYYSGVYSPPPPVNVTQIFPADYRPAPPALPGTPRQRIEEFDPPAKAERPAPAKEAAVRVEVRVPADAEVWFDGKKTSQTGTVRHFQSPPLKAGERYGYEVRASWKRVGQETEKIRHLSVRAGDRVTVDFSPASEPETLPPPKPDKP